MGKSQGSEICQEVSVENKMGFATRPSAVEQASLSSSSDTLEEVCYCIAFLESYQCQSRSRSRNVTFTIESETPVQHQLHLNTS